MTLSEQLLSLANNLVGEMHCPECDSKEVNSKSTDDGRTILFCNACGFEWQQSVKKNEASMMTIHFNGPKFEQGKINNANWFKSRDTLEKHGWRGLSGSYTHPKFPGHMIVLQHTGSINHQHLNRPISPGFVTHEKIDDYLKKFHGGK